MRLREAPKLVRDVRALSVRLDMGRYRSALVEALADTLRRKATQQATP
jgi:hypothetical protein